MTYTPRINSNSTASNKVFLNYIHNFRGIAIIYIVAGHCFSAFVWQDSSMMTRIARLALNNGTVFFVFIAGFLFQHLLKSYTPKKYFLSKLSGVWAPYLLISIPAIVFFVFFQQREEMWTKFYEWPQWLQILYFYLTGAHLTPFWFIPMISLFYLAAPILIILDKYKWSYLCLPALVLLSCYVPRGLPYQSFVHFFSAYFFGMFCSHYKTWVNTKLSNTIVFCALAFAYIVLFFIELNYMEDDLYSYMNFLRKLILCGVFIALLLRFNFHNKYLSLVAELSFGIFFIHSYVISALKMAEDKFIGHYLQGNMLGFIFFIMVVLLICIGIILIIKRILAANSRYLIGC